MPMPEYRGEFPGKPWDQAYDQYGVHNAWYSNDTDSLLAIYSQHGGFKARPSQFAGGLQGRIARWFWGNPAVQPSKRIHVPAAADIARTSADLLFGQSPQWDLAEGDATNLETTKDRLVALLEGPDVAAILLEAGEIQSALGGVFLRLWWDDDVTDKICISAVAPDSAIPTWRYGKLAGVTFWSIVQEDKRGVYRHLEHHEPGRIEHALYFGDADTIGRPVPLDEIDQTAWAAELVDADGAIETGVEGLTAAYVPNVRPNRIWRNTPGLSPLGRSDFDGLEPLFDALDEAYSSWMRDLEHGKSKLFVADEALTDNGPGNGATYDPDQAVYTPVPTTGLGSAADATRALVQAQQFAIRYAEHKATCQAIMNRILVGAGYSIADFGDDEMTAAITATEVNAKKDLSNRTRDKKILYWRSALQPLARTMIELDEAVYGGSYGLKADPELKFPVRPDQSPVQLSQTILNLKQAEALSTNQSVRMFNPNWSTPDVEDEVNLIHAEAKAAAELGMPAHMPGEFGNPSFGGGSSGGGVAGKPEPHTDIQAAPGTTKPTVNGVIEPKM